MHSLLKRQIRRYIGNVEHLPAEHIKLFDAINSAYEQNDIDRKLIERSLDIVSQELLAKNLEISSKLREIQATESRLLHSISILNATLDSTGDAVLMVGKDQKVEGYNEEFIGLWGMPEEVIEQGDGHRLFAWLIGKLSDNIDFDEYSIGRTKSNDIVSGGVELKDKRIFEYHTEPCKIKGEIVGRVWCFQDVTEREKNQKAMQLASMVYESSSEAILVCDANNIIIDVNPAFEKITGYMADEVIGKTPGFFKSGRHDADFYKDMWHILNTEGRWAGEVWDKRKNGDAHAKYLKINVIKNDKGEIFRYVGMFTDVTERKQIEHLVWQQSNFDVLTKLPNRHMFLDRLKQDAKKSFRSEGTLALMLIDLDRFKEINDTLGHDMGDALLVETARRIIGCVREMDTVARLGGDEFAIILTGIDSKITIERIAQDINGKLLEPFILGSERAYISASIGISLYPNDTKELDILFKNAEQAMYAAKSEGRNRFSYYTSSMQEEARQHMRLINDLRAAQANGQFRVYYQPIVDLASGRIHKAEALLRWLHPDLGMISPADFIPLAEETGLIVPIGNWVFKQAVQQVRDWRRRYDASFQVSVNKSPLQFRYHGNNFVSWPDYLEQQGVDGQSITVEITEGLLLSTDTSSTEKLRRYHDAGLQVSIDDFGTGYSSLSYLKKFEIDYLKIDQSFIHNLEFDANNRAICEAIIVMAHKLGLKVIAEGVEATGQRDFLVETGCDFAQGYLYSRPVAPEEFEKLFY